MTQGPLLAVRIADDIRIIRRRCNLIRVQVSLAEGICGVIAGKLVDGVGHSSDQRRKAFGRLEA